MGLLADHYNYSWEGLEEKAPPGQWEYFERGDQV